MDSSKVSDDASGLLKTLRVDGFVRRHPTEKAAELARRGLAKVSRYGVLLITNDGRDYQHLSPPQPVGAANEAPDRSLR